MAIPGSHRVQVAVDCECGTTVEACDDEEFLDELLEHIAAAHEAGASPRSHRPADGGLRDVKARLEPFHRWLLRMTIPLWLHRR